MRALRSRGSERLVLSTSVTARHDGSEISANSERRDPTTSRPASRARAPDANRPLRHFDGHPNDLGRGAGAGNQPIAQLLDPQAAMRNGSLAQALSAGIDQANLMALARPVDAHKPFNLFRHAQALLSHHTPPGRRNERESLYSRSTRNLPRDFRRGRPAGARARPGCSNPGNSRAPPGRPARPGQSTMPTSR